MLHSVRDVAKASTLGGGGGGGVGPSYFQVVEMFPENVEDGEEVLVGQKNVYDQNKQGLQFFSENITKA